MKQINRQHLSILLILLAGSGISISLVAKEKDPLPQVIVKQPQAVAVIIAKTSNRRLNIPAWGLVEPRERVDIRTRVEGTVDRVADGLVAGAVVRRGALLFTLDPRDYQIVLDEAAAAFEQVRQTLEIEKGRQEIARAEYELLRKDYTPDERNTARILRRPQLKEREAALQIASARREQAVLNLARTRLTAPCDGRVIDENLAPGHFMEKGSIALRVACTDRYHIIAGFSPGRILDPDIKTVSAVINGTVYPGELKGILPQIHPDTRRKQVLITLKGTDIPAGTYASVLLPGRFFKQVISLPKTALRAGKTIWVMRSDDTLDIRTVSLKGEDGESVIVDQGISPGDRVILSHIAGPVKGMKLRIKKDRHP